MAGASLFKYFRLGILCDQIHHDARRVDIKSL